MNNLIIIEGNLTKDVESKIVGAENSQKNIVNFTVAINEGKDKPAQFIRCTAWNGKAELAKKDLNKGDLVRIFGKIKTEQWKDEKGETKYSFHVDVNHWELMIKKTK